MKKFNLVPIETVLQDYCSVKVSSGRSQQNVECPFHNDTSKNSLCCYKNTNSAYCFAGCGNFGPVEIVMRHLGVDQVAATQELMSRYGLAPLTPEDEATLRRESLLAKYVEATHRHLTEEHRVVLRSRGLTDETINQLKVGFHQNDFEGLSDSEAIELGVYKQTRDEVVSDFAGKIIIPGYCNHRLVQVMAWNFASLPDEPKYEFPSGWPRPILGISGDNPVVVEGIFDLLACQQAGVPALCMLGAHASAAQFSFLEQLQSFTLLLDGDDAGIAAANELASRLYPKAKVIEVPVGEDPASLLVTMGQPAFTKWLLSARADAPDWLDAEIEKMAIRQDDKAVQQSLETVILPVVGRLNPLKIDSYCTKIARLLKKSGITKKALLSQAKSLSEQDEPDDDRNLVDLLYEAVVPTVTLFRDQHNSSFAQVTHPTHNEIMPIQGETFKRYLRKIAQDELGKLVGSDLLNTVIGQLDSNAAFSGRTIKLQNRVAWHDGAIYYDMSDEKNSATKIDNQGWQTVSHPPILLRREEHQTPQTTPVPLGQGSLTPLINLFHLTSDQALLLSVWLVYCLLPELPKVFLYIQAEKGSGKTDLSRALRRLIDPSSIASLKEPRIEDRAVSQLEHHYLPIFDNLNVLSPWFARLIYTASTGESDERRKLYSDDGVKIFSYVRPMIINAINRLGIQYPDLQERMLLLKLERIPDDKRLESAEFWEKFESIRATVLGGMFETLSAAMRIKPTLVVENPPRMADWACWGSAIAIALGYTQDEFLAAYRGNMAEANAELLTDHPVANAVWEFMQGKPSWHGPASKLLEELEDLALDLKTDIKAKTWPKTPSALSHRINEITSNLKDSGILVEMGQEPGPNAGRYVDLRWNNPSSASITPPQDLLTTSLILNPDQGQL